MKHDLEPLDRLMGNVIEQLNEIIASLKLTQIEQPEPEPEPKAPNTIEAVYEQVDPKYSTIPTEVPYLLNVNQVDAFAQLLTLVKALDDCFGDGDGRHVWYIDREYDVTRTPNDDYDKPLITFATEEAAEHARDYFMPLIKQFYGVTP